MVKERKYSTKFVSMEIKNFRLSIFCRITMYRKKAEFSTGITCAPEEWDSATNKFHETTPQNKYLNSKLSQIEGTLYGCYLSLLKKGLEPTAKRIRNEYRGNEPDADRSASLVDYVGSFIKTISLKKNEYTIGTINHYHTFHRKLKLFLESSDQKELKLKEIRRRHIMEFQDYLLTTKQGEGLNPVVRSTSNTYIKKLKVVIKDAIDREIISHNPFSGYVMQGTSLQREFLTKDEIEKIKEVKLDRQLEKVRDTFVFSVYTGLRFSDAMNLRKEDIKKESDGLYWMSIRQRKTNQYLYRPLLKDAADLYEKFLLDYKDSPYVLPRCYNQKLNAYLRVIADLAGIKKKISHHTARHSFATSVLLENGIDIKIVSYFLCHASMKTTEIYAKVTNERASNVVRQLSGEQV